jgi:transcriptional regulator with XRE-family HTH domain
MLSVVYCSAVSRAERLRRRGRNDSISVDGGYIITYDNSIMNPLSISETLRRRRLETGLSLTQLARRVNTSTATLSRYEHGWRRFEVYTLEKLATALGCRLRIDFEPRAAPLPNRGRAAAVRRLNRLFWDRPLETRHFDEYPSWVVKRTLEYGTLQDVHCLVHVYGQRRFLEEVAKTRFASARTENLWREILKKEGIPCMQKSFRDKAKGSWPS